MKIRIPLETLKLIPQPSKDSKGWVAVVKKGPAIFRVAAGAAHWCEWRTPFLVQGGFYVPPEGERQLPWGEIKIYKITENWLEANGKGFAVFELVNDIAKPVNTAEYDATLYMFRCSLHSRTHAAEIQPLDSRDSEILYCDRTSTRIDSVAILVAKIPRGGSLLIRYTSSAPYRGGEKDWSEVEIIDENGEIKRRTPPPPEEEVV